MHTYEQKLVKTARRGSAASQCKRMLGYKHSFEENTGPFFFGLSSVF